MRMSNIRTRAMILHTDAVLLGKTQNIFTVLFVNFPKCCHPSSLEPHPHPPDCPPAGVQTFQPVNRRPHFRAFFIEPFPCHMSHSLMLIAHPLFVVSLPNLTNSKRLHWSVETKGLRYLPFSSSYPVNLKEFVYVYSRLAVNNHLLAK